MLVRVVGIPPGEAPENIRRAWVGLVLPVAEGTLSPEVIPGFGVLSGKPITDADGRSLGTTQYPVPATTAVVLLERVNPQAAAWWREAVPDAIQTGQLFGFAAEVCEPIHTGVDHPDSSAARPGGASGTLLEVTYTLTLSDLVECSMRFLKRSPAGRQELVSGWVVSTGGLLAFGALLYFFVHWTFALGCGILAVFCAIFFPMSYRRGKERSIREFVKSHGTRGVIGPITLTLTEDTLTYRTETTTTTAKWRDMKGVQDLGDAIQILVSGLQAAIVPRRGFERADECAAVRDFALAMLPRLP